MNKKLVATKRGANCKLGTVIATVEQLTEILGPPIKVGDPGYNDDDYKVSQYFDVPDSEGNPHARIWCYKGSSLFNQWSTDLCIEDQYTLRLKLEKLG